MFLLLFLSCLWFLAEIQARLPGSRLVHSLNQVICRGIVLPDRRVLGHLVSWTDVNLVSVVGFAALERGDAIELLE